MRFLRSAVAAIAVGLLACGRTSLVVPVPAGDAAVPRDAGVTRERCNGVDDDGDGEVDEDQPDRTCGLGDCRRVVPGCVNGRVPECTPGSPAVEVCGGGDEDCDGEVDEGLGIGPVGARVEVRTDEGSAGACPGCVTAVGTDLVVGEGALLVAWRLGFSPSARQANVFHRAIRADGAAVAGLVRRTFDDWVASGGVRFAAAEDAHALVFCGGELRAARLDVVQAARLGVEGTVLSPPQSVPPAARPCGPEGADVLSTGAGYLVAWTEAEGTDFAIQLTQLDEAFGLVGTRTIAARGGTPGQPPRLARAGERVLLAVGFTRGGLDGVLLRPLDLEGEDAAPEVFLAPPGPQAERSRWGDVRVVPQEEGFLVLGVEPTRADVLGRFAARVTFDAEVVVPPNRIDAARRFFETDAEPRLGGAALLAGNQQSMGEVVPFVAVLDEDGEEVARWAPPPDREGLFIDPDLEVRGEDVFLAWSAPGNTAGVPNQVFLRRLGCAR